MLLQLVLAVSMLVSLALAGGKTVSATIDAGRVDCASPANMLAVEANKEKATFILNDQKITVDKTQIRWGNGDARLPEGWKHVRLYDDGSRIYIYADGKPFTSF